jgi:hypothetical protein
MPELVDVAGLAPQPLPELVTAMTALFAPDVETAESVAPMVLELAIGMASAGTHPARAALDGILAIVASGRELNFESGIQRQQSKTVNDSWWSAKRLAIAVLGSQLAAAGSRIARLIGPGVLGSYRNFGIPGAPSLDETYFERASLYIEWQRKGLCLCLGETSAEHERKAERHYLRKWRPGRRDSASNRLTDASDLALWFRTWVIGQQKSDVERPGGRRALHSKSFETGLFYRHFLPSLEDVSLILLIDEVLEEQCTELHCSRAYQRAYRVRRTDTVADTSIRAGDRQCLQGSDHDLDYSRPPRYRTREMIILSAVRESGTHRRYGQLSWDVDLGRWQFVAGRGSRRWLPLPHGRAYKNLMKRGEALANRFRPPVIAWSPAERTRNANRESLPTGLSPDDRAQGAQIPADARRILDTELVEKTGPGGAEALKRVIEALLPTGLIAFDPSCSCCMQRSAMPEGDDPQEDYTGQDYCSIRLEQVVVGYLLERGVNMSGER